MFSAFELNVDGALSLITVRQDGARGRARIAIDGVVRHDSAWPLSRAYGLALGAVYVEVYLDRWSREHRVRARPSVPLRLVHSNLASADRRSRAPATLWAVLMCMLVVGSCLVLLEASYVSHRSEQLSRLPALPTVDDAAGGAGGRPAGAPSGERPSGERPSGERPSGERQSGERLDSRRRGPAARCIGQFNSSARWPNRPVGPPVRPPACDFSLDELLGWAEAAAAAAAAAEPAATPRLELVGAGLESELHVTLDGSHDTFTDSGPSRTRRCSSLAVLAALVARTGGSSVCAGRWRSRRDGAAQGAAAGPDGGWSGVVSRGVDADVLASAVARELASLLGERGGERGGGESGGAGNAGGGRRRSASIVAHTCDGDWLSALAPSLDGEQLTLVALGCAPPCAARSAGCYACTAGRARAERLSSLFDAPHWFGLGLGANLVGSAHPLCAAWNDTRPADAPDGRAARALGAPAGGAPSSSLVLSRRLLSAAPPTVAPHELAPRAPCRVDARRPAALLCPPSHPVLLVDAAAPAAGAPPPGARALGGDGAVCRRARESGGALHGEDFECPAGCVRTPRGALGTGLCAAAPNETAAAAARAGRRAPAPSLARGVRPGGVAATAGRRAAPALVTISPLLAQLQQAAIELSTARVSLVEAPSFHAERGALAAAVAAGVLPARLAAAMRDALLPYWDAPSLLAHVSLLLSAAGVASATVEVVAPPSPPLAGSYLVRIRLLAASRTTLAQSGAESAREGTAELELLDSGRQQRLRRSVRAPAAQPSAGLDDDDGNDDGGDGTDDGVPLRTLAALGLDAAGRRWLRGQFVRLPLAEDGFGRAVVVHGSRLRVRGPPPRTALGSMLPVLTPLLSALINLQQALDEFGLCAKADAPLVLSEPPVAAVGMCLHKHAARLMRERALGPCPGEQAVLCGDGVCRATYVDCFRARCAGAEGVALGCAGLYMSSAGSGVAA